MWKIIKKASGISWKLFVLVSLICFYTLSYNIRAVDDIHYLLQMYQSINFYKFVWLNYCSNNIQGTLKEQSGAFL